MTRKEMIDMLIDINLSDFGTREFELWIRDILRFGITGYENMTDDEIEQFYKEAIA